MRMQIRICTEADYLLAHLTVMDAEFHGKTPSLHHVKQRLKFVLTKWIVPGHLLGFQPVRPIFRDHF